MSLLQLDFSGACSAQAIVLMGAWANVLILPPWKSWPKPFPLSIPGWWQSRTQPLASCLLFTSRVMWLWVSQVEVLPFVLPLKQRSEVGCFCGLPLHLPAMAQCWATWGLENFPGIHVGGRHYMAEWYGQGEPHKTQIMNCWNRIIPCLVGEALLSSAGRAHPVWDPPSVDLHLWIFNYLHPGVIHLLAIHPWTMCSSNAKHITSFKEKSWVSSSLHLPTPNCCWTVQHILCTIRSALVAWLQHHQYSVHQFAIPTLGNKYP